VVDPETGQVTVPADYSQLGDVFIVLLVIGLTLPFLIMWLLRLTRLRTA
jgi:hypothetical protein